MDFLVKQLFNGISYSALIFLLGGGLTLIFGVMKIINLAQGSFYLLGGYVAYFIVRKLGSFYVGIFVACITVALLGMLIERYLLRGLEGRDMRQILMTMGIALFIQDSLLMLFGGNPLSLNIPDFFSVSIKIGKYSFLVLRFIMMGAAAIVFVALWLIQEKTRTGAILRASVDNKEIAQGLGINVHFVTMNVFGLGALLAAFGGVIGCALTAIYPGLDFEVLPYAFVVVIIGGMGSLKGALIGSLIVGLMDNFGRALFPELSAFTLFAPMVIMLAVRPTGLFGKE